MLGFKTLRSKLLMGFSGLIVFSLLIGVTAAIALHQTIDVAGFSNQIQQLEVTLQKMHNSQQQLYIQGANAVKPQLHTSEDAKEQKERYEESQSILMDLMARPEATELGLKNHFHKIQTLIQEYEDAFLRLVNLHEERNHHEKGLVTQLDSLFKHIAERMPEEYKEKMLRTHEHQNQYLKSHRPDHVTLLQEDLDFLRNNIETTQKLNEIQKQELAATLNLYEEKLDEIIAIDEEVGLDQNKGLWNRLQISLGKTAPIFNKSLVKIKDHSSSWMNQMTSVIFILITVSVVGSLAIGLFLSNGLSKPLILLKKAAGRVAAGDVDVTIDIHSKDEVGDLATTFQEVISNNKELASAASHIGRGDFSVDIQPRSEEDALSLALLDMRNNLCDLQTRTDEENSIKTQINAVGELSQKHGDMQMLLTEVLSQLSEKVEAGYSVFYLAKDKIEEDQKDEEQELQLFASYAYKERKHITNKIVPGEGLVGQCALENKSILISNVPKDYVSVHSGLGERPPLSLFVLPVSFENHLIGVLEFAAFHEFSKHQLILLEQVSDSLGAVIHNMKSRQRTEKLLEETQVMAEKMRSQQEELRTSNEQLAEKSNILEQSEEELRASNEELADKTRVLEQSEEELRASNEELAEKTRVLEQSEEELRASNEELQTKATILEQQKEKIENTSFELLKTKEAIEKKAADLEQASKYKSEFLANMSHELRTPLNSLLILSKGFADNEVGNLDEDQVEEAQIIHEGGQELLSLINDILDLSKVEAGKLSIQIESIMLSNLQQSLQSKFKHVAEQKGLQFNVVCEENTPEMFPSDYQRIGQILKNLLSNAIKFTDNGGVTLRFYLPSADCPPLKELTPDTAIAFDVIDTGIGIPEDKQKAIFEAFQQADGSTSRTYGGTGLGLTISRELAKLLGGEIQLKSEAGKGSVFTVFLPKDAETQEKLMPKGDEEGPSLTSAAESSTPSAPPPAAPPAAPMQNAISEPVAPAPIAPPPVAMPEPVASPAPSAEQTTEAPTQPMMSTAPSYEDDREKISIDSKSLLIVEDDPNFVKIIMKLAKKNNYLCLAAGSGQEGLELAKKYHPKGIILDLGLPDMNGLELLGKLKEDPRIKDIPVHIVSGRSDIGGEAKGAAGCLLKPVPSGVLHNLFKTFDEVVSPDAKNILIIEDDPATQRAITKILSASKKEDVQTTTIPRGQVALEVMKTKSFDCVILDLTLPDMDGLEWLEKSHQMFDEMPPCIVYTAKTLDQDEHQELSRYSRSIVVKGSDSPERLYDEVSLFLHSVERSAPVNLAEPITEGVHNEEKTLAGRKVLLVDDDPRNIFALTKVLEKQKLEVVIANNGQQALERLQETDGVELVIMDMMMPVMDGFEATKRIRDYDHWKNLPVIVLTAKAMAEDREKCLAVGANDYLTKPVDVEKLIGMLKIWMFK